MIVRPNVEEKVWYELAYIGIDRHLAEHLLMVIVPKLPGAFTERVMIDVPFSFTMLRFEIIRRRGNPVVTAVDPHVTRYFRCD